MVTALVGQHPWLIGLLLAGAGVGLTVGFYFLFYHRNQAWVSAVTATFTLALVFLTGCYALLTYRLVLAQVSPAEAVRLSEQESSARRLAQKMMQLDVPTGKGLFPVLFGANSPDTRPFSTIVEQLRSVAEEITADALQLSSPQAVLALVVVVRLQRAQQRILLLTATVTGFQATGRAWDADELKGYYYAHIKPDGEDEVEWGDIISGQYLDKARSSFNDLHEKLLHHVLGPDPT